MKNLDMAFHHGLVFALFIPAIMNWAILPLAIMNLVLEFSNVFLHGRRLLLWAGVSKQDTSYRLNLAALMSTFFALRMGVVFYSTYASYIFWRRYDEFSGFYPLPSWFPFCCYNLVTIVNLVMLMQLYNSDLKGKSRKSESKS